MLDEPHAGLDSSARAVLDELIGEATTGGATVLIASHESALVEPLVTRAVTVTGGRVTAERCTGVSRAPLERPAATASGPTPTEPPGGPGGASGADPRVEGEVAHVA
jgi:ABC-type Mn2+/Zn2+ transport system ATPase subunit